MAFGQAALELTSSLQLPRPKTIPSLSLLFHRSCNKLTDELTKAKKTVRKIGKTKFFDDIIIISGNEVLAVDVAVIIIIVVIF